MRLTLSPQIPADLREIAAYISEDSPKRAASVVRAIRMRTKQIAKQPLLYQLRPEIGAEVRLVTVGQYVILFRIRERTVRIERIVHGSRDLLPILQESAE